MATVYRFRWKGCEASTITANLDPAVSSVLSNAMPKAWVDVTLDPGDPGSAAEGDLNSAMLAMGWIPFAVNPATPLRAVTEKQEIAIDLLVDAAVASPVFQTLLTTPITTDAGFVDVLATLSGSALVTPAYFRILLDGAPLGGGAALGIGNGSVAISKRAPVLPGAHTITLEWRAAAVGGSALVNPASAPDSDHASLYVREVVA